MATGDSDVYLGTDVGKWGVEGAGIFFWLAEGEQNFFTPCVYTPNVQIFVENSNMGENLEKEFDPVTRPPSRPLAAGPSICHLSRGGGGEQGGDHNDHRNIAAISQCEPHSPNLTPPLEYGQSPLKHVIWKIPSVAVLDSSGGRRPHVGWRLQVARAVCARPSSL